MRRPKPPLPPEYTYDVVEGIHSVRLPEEEAKKVRAEIDSLKQLDSTLTDDEALQMMHDMIYEMIVRYGIHKKEQSLPILIKARKVASEKGLPKWEAVDEVIKEMKKKSRMNFFRPDRGGNIGYGSDSDSAPTKQIDITVRGTIKYKKHLINKDTGLDTLTVDMALRYAKVYIRGYWLGQGATYFVGPPTDDNGRFSILIGGVTPPGYFMTSVFFTGAKCPARSEWL